MKIKLLLLSLCAIICISAVTGAIAQYTAEKEVVNTAKTDTVDIELEEYQLDDNSSLVDFVDPVNKMPGTSVSKIPIVYNKGSECWLRVKIEFSIDDENLYPISLDDIDGWNTDDWSFGSDGYYYYKNKFSENSEIKLFDNVNIPSNWGNEYMDKHIFIDITAEAIQTKNFSPELENEKPWGDETIEECVRSRDFERKENN